MPGIQTLAQRVQRQGRGYDDVLVHMNRRELMGLEKLANQFGGSLTTNPKTGLPEAGWLNTILPMLASAAAIYFTGGAGAAGAGAGAGAGAAGAGAGGGLGAWMAANPGAVGAGAGALTGALVAPSGESGYGALYGGLSGYGMSGMMPGLTEAFSPAAAAPASNLAKAQAPQALQESMAQTAAAGAGAPMPAGITSVAPAANSLAGGPWQDASAAMSATPSAASTAAGPSFFDKYGKSMLATGVGALGMASLEDLNEGSSGVPTGPTGQIRPYKFNPMQPKKDKYGSIIPGQYTAPSYTALPRTSYGLGGMVAGRGDGLSDSVPAVIDGRQPAQLSDGEFVVSSDVVSALGGGSTNAGARKLYAMMNRVRQQATGSPKQMRKVNPKKVMPV